jgi:hypothetical protein
MHVWQRVAYTTRMAPTAMGARAMYLFLTYFKFAASDSVTTPAPMLGGVSFYRQQARDHSICTIIRTDALLTFTFKDKIHQLTVRE